MPERIVFDTNIRISGQLWRGKPYQCLLLARGGVIEVSYCEPMVAEFAEKLRRKFRFTENQIHAAVYDMRRFGTHVNIAGSLHMIADDPDDDKFIECAVVSLARVIVSGDEHLLRLGMYGGIEILTASQFLARFI